MTSCIKNVVQDLQESFLILQSQIQMQQAIQVGVSQIFIKYFLGLEHQPAPGHPVLYGLGHLLEILLAWAPGTKNSLWQEPSLLLPALQLLHLWGKI